MFVEGLADLPEVKQRLRAVIGAALGTVAGEAATAGSATIAAALEDYAAGDARPAEQVLRERVERKAAEGAAAREASIAARQLGALLYGRDTAGALAAYHQAADLDPNDAWTWIFLARLEAQAGHLGPAEAAAVKARGAAQGSGDDRDLAAAHDELGDVRVAQGDLPGALQAFAGKEIADKLAAADQGNTEWQRDLIVSSCKLADLLERMPDHRGGAAAHWTQALVIARALAASGRPAPTDAHFVETLERRLDAAPAGADPPP